MATGIRGKSTEGSPATLPEAWNSEKHALQTEKDEARRTHQIERGQEPVRIATLNGRLRRIDEALHRIRTGRYGLCINCGTTISKLRLEQDPATEFCLLCQAESGVTSLRPRL